MRKRDGIVFFAEVEVIISFKMMVIEDIGGKEVDSISARRVTVGNLKRQG